MSRATHDFECPNGHIGKVPDDVIRCPECGVSIEGSPIPQELVVKLLRKLREKDQEPINFVSKEVK